jgi:SAM-dependent methyltransferase
MLHRRKDAKVNPTPGRRGNWVLDADGPSSLFQLFLVSVASLYIEVMLIRWIGTEFRLFAYIQNLTLVACLLGLGLGCLRASEKPRYLFNFEALGFVVIIIELPWPGWKDVLDYVVSELSASSDLSIWFLANFPNAPIRPFLVGAGFVAGLLLLVIATMIPLGSWVARFLESSARIVPAYSVNLLGSLAGVWFFAGVSFLRLAPIIWFLIAIALLLLTHPQPKKIGVWGWIMIALWLGLVALEGRAAGKTIWSPYQKLEVIPDGGENYEINADNSSSMSIANLKPEYLQKNPEMARLYAEGNSYDTPYRFVETVDDVLLVGSGAGNDAAAALRHGAGHVDAVEIDPVIRSFGQTLHPERPYGSPKVHAVLDDARDYMRRTDQRYDLIVFGLLDSHSQSSSFSNMRVDSYVYTTESFENAKRLLKPSGVLVLKFDVHAPHTWIGQRFYSMLDDVFARPPVVFYSPQVLELFSASVFIESQDPALWARAASPELAQLLKDHPLEYPLSGDESISPTTDDWPYVYHKSRTVPKIYWSVSAILILMAFLLVRKKFPYRQNLTWQFFFLGAGFLLLETQMVSRLALYFGSTWLVTCIALTFILLVLVAANLVVDRVPSIRLLPMYALLVASLIGIYAVPWIRLPFGTRWVGTLLGCAFSVPLFFAGIIFTESFRRAKGTGNFLGSNILGAVAGGIAQNLSFVFGMKALLLVAALFYAVAGMLALFSKETETLPVESGARESA